MLSDKLEKLVIKTIYKWGYFGKIKLKKHKLFMEQYNLSKMLIRAIIQTYTQYQIIKCHKTILPAFDNTFYNLMQISKQYNIPPYQLVRKFHYSPSKKEDKLLQKYDIYMHPENIKIIHEKAQQFEIKFENLLRKFKISDFKTENDLRKEHSKLTPDFYFPHGFIIGTNKINWIDVKNFYGGNNEIVIARLKKQGDKYVKKFGNGCFVFNHNFNEKLQIDRCILFDYKDFVEKLSEKYL
jgi:hypothetical protein